MKNNIAIIVVLGVMLVTLLDQAVALPKAMESPKVQSTGAGFWRIKAVPQSANFKPLQVGITDSLKRPIKLTIIGVSKASDPAPSGAVTITIQASASYPNSQGSHPVTATLEQKLVIAIGLKNGALDYNLSPGSWTAQKDAVHVEVIVKESKRSTDGRILGLDIIMITKYRSSSKAGDSTVVPVTLGSYTIASEEGVQ